jgi:hypothetical protein
MSLTERAYKLIEILGHPNKEIVIDIKLSDIEINSIEVINSIIYINIWDDEFEIKYLFSDLNYDDKILIVETLEDILKN